MFSKKVFASGFMILALLFTSACGTFQFGIEETPTAEDTLQPEATPRADEIPTEVLAARDLALNYVANLYGSDAPPPSLDWAGEIVTAEGLIGAMHYRFSAGDWVITIIAPVVAPDMVVYQVTLTNSSTGFEWMGTVDAEGQVTEETATDVSEIQVIGWRGAVYSLPPEGQFDDYVLFQSGGAFGLTGADADLEAQIVGLRDKAEPGKYAHFWGTLTCEVPAFNGCELLVTRLRAGATTTDPEPIENLEGRVVSGIFNGGLTETLVLTGPIPTRYGLAALDGPESEMAAQLQSLSDTGSIIRISGQLVTGVPDVNGSQLQVTELEVVEVRTAPPEMPVVAWYGQVHTILGPWSDFEAVLVLPFGGVVGLSGANATVQSEIAALKDTNQEANFWGTLTCNLLTDLICQLTVSRLRVDGPGEFYDPEPVEGWEGILVSSAFNMGLFTVLVTTEGPFPIYYSLDSADPELAAQLETLRDTGATVRIWGEISAGVMGMNATSIQVTRFEILQ